MRKEEKTWVTLLGNDRKTSLFLNIPEMNRHLADRWLLYLMQEHKILTLVVPLLETWSQQSDKWTSTSCQHCLWTFQCTQPLPRVGREYGSLPSYISEASKVVGTFPHQSTESIKQKTYTKSTNYQKFYFNDVHKCIYGHFMECASWLTNLENLTWFEGQGHEVKER